MAFSCFGWFWSPLPLAILQTRFAAAFFVTRLGAFSRVFARFVKMAPIPAARQFSLTPVFAAHANHFLSFSITRPYHGFR
jgi:hypothetical protein